MADGDGNKSGFVGAVAGMVVGGLIVGAVVYFVLRPSPLARTLSDDDVKTMKTTEQRKDRENLAELEKKFGSEHPQVKQMKMELGDAPFPDTPAK